MERIQEISKRVAGLSLGEVSGWISDLEKEIIKKPQERLDQDSQIRLQGLRMDIEDLAFLAEDPDMEIDNGEWADKLLGFARRIREVLEANA